MIYNKRHDATRCWSICLIDKYCLFNIYTLFVYKRNNVASERFFHQEIAAGEEDIFGMHFAYVILHIGWQQDS